MDGSKLCAASLPSGTAFLPARHACFLEQCAFYVIGFRKKPMWDSGPLGIHGGRKEVKLHFCRRFWGVARTIKTAPRWHKNHRSFALFTCLLKTPRCALHACHLLGDMLLELSTSHGIVAGEIPQLLPLLGYEGTHLFWHGIGWVFEIRATNCSLETTFWQYFKWNEGIPIRLEMDNCVLKTGIQITRRKYLNPIYAAIFYV